LGYACKNPLSSSNSKDRGSAIKRSKILILVNFTLFLDFSNSHFLLIFGFRTLLNRGSAIRGPKSLIWMAQFYFISRLSILIFGSYTVFSKHCLSVFDNRFARFVIMYAFGGFDKKAFSDTISRTARFKFVITPPPHFHRSTCIVTFVFEVSIAFFIKNSRSPHHSFAESSLF
jgi:hypothetical protein